MDDVWINTKTGKIHIIDYKSTSQKSAGKEITLDDQWKVSYKRQMDMYVWIMRRKEFDESSTGYFLYCDGDRFSQYDFLGVEEAVMKFKMSLLPYDVSTEWIEPTLVEIKKCLTSDKTPKHSETCEYGSFIQNLNH